MLIRWVYCLTTFLQLLEPIHITSITKGNSFEPPGSIKSDLLFTFWASWSDLPWTFSIFIVLPLVSVSGSQLAVIGFWLLYHNLPRYDFDFKTRESKDMLFHLTQPKPYHKLFSFHFAPTPENPFCHRSFRLNKTGANS